MLLSMRFDMRAPEFGAAAEQLYRAAIEQTIWAERLGFETVYLAEHHGTEDGYCSAPMILAAAIASRTSRIELHFSALVAVLHHPLRLAEDLTTLDIISSGRIAMTLGIGYRDSEYAMFGIDKGNRVRALREIVEVLQLAWTGEPFEFRGTTVQIRPRPVRSPRPPIYIAGSSAASARRAATLGDNYLPSPHELWDVYQAERERLGLSVPPRPPRRGPRFLFVTDDPDRDWEVVAPHILHTTNSYATWTSQRSGAASTWNFADGLADLKGNPGFAVVTPDQCVALAREFGPDAEMVFHPLFGGLLPDISWRSLELFENKVLPRLVDMGYRESRSDSL